MRSELLGGVESKLGEGDEDNIIFVEGVGRERKKNSLKPFILSRHHQDDEGLSYLRGCGRRVRMKVFFYIYIFYFLYFFFFHIRLFFLPFVYIFITIFKKNRIYIAVHSMLVSFLPESHLS